MLAALAELVELWVVVKVVKALLVVDVLLPVTLLLAEEPLVTVAVVVEPERDAGEVEAEADWVAAVGVSRAN